MSLSNNWLSLASAKAGEAGDGYSGQGVISPNGKYVAFLSSASNLYNGSSRSGSQVLLKDLKSGTIYHITNKNGWLGDGDIDVAYPQDVSNNGDVLFLSDQKWVETDDSYGDQSDLYLWRKVDSSFTRVNDSLGWGGELRFRSAKFSGSNTNTIFADAYVWRHKNSQDYNVSYEFNLKEDSYKLLGELAASEGSISFIGEASGKRLFRKKKLLYWLSSEGELYEDSPLRILNKKAFEGNTVGTDIQITENGNAVAFLSSSPNLEGYALTDRHAYIGDLRTGSVRLIDSDSNGSKIKYSGDTQRRDLPVYDSGSGSHDGTGWLSVSEDGKYAAFATWNRTSNLAGHSWSQSKSIELFIKDLYSGSVRRVDQKSTNRGGLTFHLSRDGSHLYFDTYAAQFDGDQNKTRDVYIAKNPFTSGAGWNDQGSLYSRYTVASKSLVLNEPSSGRVQTSLWFKRTGNLQSIDDIKVSIRHVDTDGRDFSGGSSSHLRFLSGQDSDGVAMYINSDEITEGNEKFIVRIEAKDSNNSNILPTETLVTIVDYDRASYSISPSPSVAKEGEEVRTNLSTTNVAAGTRLYWALSGTGIKQADFSSGTIHGSTLLGADGTFTFAHTLANDRKTEGAETLNIKLYSNKKRTNQVGSTASVQINDTSITAIKKSTTPTKLNNDYVQFSTPKGTQRPTGAMGKYYDYVDRYPLTLKQAFITDYRSGKTASQHLWGQKHWLNNGSKQGRVLQVKTGKEDTNDYGAYVENYGTTLLDEYRKDSRAIINGGELSLFNWGKDHYNTMGKARGRQINGGADFGAIIKLNSSLYARWQDARIADPALTAFDFGYRNQNVIKQTLGVKLGRDTKEKLTGQYVYSLGGNDVLTGTSGNDILSGGFNDDLIANGMGGEDTVFGGPGRDVFRLNTGGKLNIRDYRAGDDFIQLGDGISESDIKMSFNGFNNTTSFQSGSEVLATVYGTNPNSFSFAQQSDGVDNVYI